MREKLIERDRGGDGKHKERGNTIGTGKGYRK